MAESRAARDADEGDGVRRFRLRLNQHRIDEAELLAYIDERSAGNPNEAQEFLRRCALVGFLVQYKSGFLAETLATYSNNSQYTNTDRPDPSASGIASLTGVTSTPEADGSLSAPKGEGEGVVTLMGLLKGSSSESEVSV